MVRTASRATKAPLVLFVLQSALVILLASSARAADDILELTESNFDDILKSNERLLVEWYAPGCAPCEMFAPILEEAVSEAKKIDPSLTVGKINYEKESDLVERFQIEEFPTVRWFEKGEDLADFDAAPTVEALMKWIRRLLGDAAVTLKSNADVDVARASEVAMIGYFDALEGAEYDAFKKLAVKDNDVDFYQTTSKEVANALGMKASSPPSFMVMRNYEGHAPFAVELKDHDADKVSVTKPFDRLNAFLYAEKLPNYFMFNADTAEETLRKALSLPVPVHTYIVGPTEDLKHDSALMQAASEAGNRIRSSAALLASQLSQEDGAGHPIVDMFDLDIENDDLKKIHIIGVQIEGSARYRCDLPESGVGAVTADWLEDCFMSMVNDTAPRIYNSAPVPSKPKDGNVTVVVGSTFDAIVKDPTKDVILEVYAPWCEYCQAFAPMYKALADALAHVPTIVVAKMDGTKNEHKDAVIEHYPTLFFFPAKEGEGGGVDNLDAGTDLRTLANFLKANVVHDFEVPDLVPFEAQVIAEQGSGSEEEEEEEESGEDSFSADDSSADVEHDEL